jgi:hypothetical protein
MNHLIHQNYTDYLTEATEKNKLEWVTIKGRYFGLKNWKKSQIINVDNCFQFSIS